MKKISTSVVIRKWRTLSYLFRMHGVQGVLGNLRDRMARSRSRVEDALPSVAIPDAREHYPHLSFKEAAAPHITIVIPAYNHWHYSYACLASLASLKDLSNFEVILVDDHSSDKTVTADHYVEGIRILRNSETLGFVESCNRGAMAANANFLLFLNNDTIVCSGALDAMLNVIANDPTVGLVGAKLLFSNGLLQEAGGIIWSDASGCNYGRGNDPRRPEYNYLREVDYCSGACILVRRSLFHRIGMFDRRYIPAYYEDTDLAFGIRQEGLKVVYQPLAEVFHFEGVSSGTSLLEGVKQYQLVNQIKFQTKWRKTLARSHDPGTALDIARERRVKKRILVVYPRIPMPDHDSGSLRMFRILEILVSCGYQVDFFADNLAFSSRYTPPLQQLGVNCLFAPHVQSLEQHLLGLSKELDVALVAHRDLARAAIPIIQKHGPSTRVIFDTVDLHFLRERREADVKGLQGMSQILDSRKSQELELMHRSAVTLVVSPYEKEVLKKESPGLNVEIFSNIHEIELTEAAFEEREGIIFVGGFEHAPNVDAIEYYASEIETLLQAILPGVVLTVIGSDIPPELLDLASETIQFTGHVPKLNPYFEKARVSIAPLRFGAGIKGKIGSSMSMGVPVVTTSIGSEGLGVRNGKELFIADSPKVFAGLVKELYCDKNSWTSMVSAGAEHVEQYSSVNTARSALLRVIDPGFDSE